MFDNPATEFLFDRSTSPTDTLVSVKSNAKLVTTGTIDPVRYTQLCKQIIDIVLPQLEYIGSAVSEDEDVEVHVQTIFLRGIPSVAFWELSNALQLKTSDHVSEFVARTLVLFVADDCGGVDRLSHVIYKSNVVDIISNLIHLPSRISNSLVSNFDLNSTGCLRLDEKIYFSTLTNAILTIPTTHDAQCEQLISQLIGRMVVMNHANTMVSCFICHDDPKRTVALLQNSPQACVEGIIKAFLNTKAETTHGERYIRRVLVSLLRESKAARDTCVYKIPFQHPLLRQSKISLQRLIKCIVAQEDKVLIEEAITTAGETWSNEEFALGADVPLQRQVTRLLLYYLSYTSRSQELTNDPALSSIMMVIVQGVHIRLNETDVRLRRYAMVIGEAASRHARDEDPLAFDRSGFADALREESKVVADDQANDDGDSDFSDIARNVGSHIVDDDCDFLDNQCNGSLKEDEYGTGGTAGWMRDSEDKREPKDELVIKSKERFDQKISASAGCDWPPKEKEHNWQDEDDWSSLASFDTSSDEDDNGPNWIRRMDMAALREKVSAPMSVARIIALLREMNSSAGGAVSVESRTGLAVLRIIADRAERRERIESLQAGAVEICLETVRLDVERYPDEDMGELRIARERAFINVMRLDIGECGCAVVRNIVCGSSADIGRRLESLTLISTAILTEETEKDSNPALRPSASHAQLHVEGLTALFRLLVDSLCEGGGADFIDVDGRDCRVWAQALVTLATIARCGGIGPEGAWMRGELIDVAVNRVSRINGDPIVRRAVALALGSVVDTMSDSDIRDKLQDNFEIIIAPKDESPNLVIEAINWLWKAKDDDADLGVRRYATVGLRKWAQRVDKL